MYVLLTGRKQVFARWQKGAPVIAFKAEHKEPYYVAGDAWEGEELDLYLGPKDPKTGRRQGGWFTEVPAPATEAPKQAPKPVPAPVKAKVEEKPKVPTQAPAKPLQAPPKPEKVPVKVPVKDPARKKRHEEE